jgi:hypothetical protein
MSKCNKCKKEKEELEKIEKCEDCGEPIYPEKIPWQFEKNDIRENMKECMHDNCPGCKNGTCSGVHMISCPCPKCSPQIF